VCVCLCQTDIFRNDQLVSVRLGTKTFPISTKPVLLLFISDNPFCCIIYTIGNNLPSKLLILILIIMINEIINSCVNSNLVNILQFLQHNGMSKTKIIAANEVEVHISACLSIYIL
jgi:hypothetical protein